MAKNCQLNLYSSLNWPKITKLSAQTAQTTLIHEISHNEAFWDSFPFTVSQRRSLFCVREPFSLWCVSTNCTQLALITVCTVENLTALTSLHTCHTRTLKCTVMFPIVCWVLFSMHTQNITIAMACFAFELNTFGISSPKILYLSECRFA